jgi:hypothetical protein
LGQAPLQQIASGFWNLRSRPLNRRAKIS